MRHEEIHARMPPSARTDADAAERGRRRRVAVHDELALMCAGGNHRVRRAQHLRAPTRVRRTVTTT